MKGNLSTVQVYGDSIYTETEMQETLEPAIIDSLRSVMLYQDRVKWYVDQAEKADKEAARVHYGHTSQEVYDALFDIKNARKISGDQIEAAQWVILKAMGEKIDQLEKRIEVLEGKGK
jgi:hypothetical protein